MATILSADERSVRLTAILGQMRTIVSTNRHAATAIARRRAAKETETAIIATADPTYIGLDAAMTSLINEMNNLSWIYQSDLLPLGILTTRGFSFIINGGAGNGTVALVPYANLPASPETLTSLFVAADTIRVSGSESGANDGLYVVSAVAANLITVTGLFTATNTLDTTARITLVSR